MSGVTVSDEFRCALEVDQHHYCLRLPLVDTDQQLAVLGQRDHTTLVSVS
jgi:hypothetical protein